MNLNNNQEVFFALLRAGLWEQDVEIGKYGDADFSEILRLATEQSVVGLVAAGLEYIKDVKVPQEWALQFAGQTLQLEQRNRVMNTFVEELITKLRDKSVYTLLVKGQGIAQCYERPMWRASGDIDLFLSDDNYSKAKQLLLPLSSSFEEELPYTQHIGMTFGNIEVELHGNLRGNFSALTDRVIDEIKQDVFYNGNVRFWQNGSTQIFLMGATQDSFYVFTHILQHFFRGGIGLRQVCDWCRLLYCYKKQIDLRLLESLLKKARLMTEWKAFGALVVEWLGMPEDAMPFYSDKVCLQRKANKLLGCILETGNLGHNIDNSYRIKKSFGVRKLTAVWRYTIEAFIHFKIFPMNTMRNYIRTMKSGLLSTLGLK